MSDITIALDAGHGGSDPGATYNGRAEKDDTLRLTRAVGKILEMNGINVYYVRDNDEYETPFKKATDANNSGADYFISIHRNSSEKNNQYSGIESLVYKDSGIRHTLAKNINKELADAGFEDLGITERPNLVVLKRTQMPAVLVEVGFINSDTDNKIFDENFNEIARAIADGILETVYSQTTKRMPPTPALLLTFRQITVCLQVPAFLRIPVCPHAVVTKREQNFTESRQVLTATKKMPTECLILF